MPGVQAYTVETGKPRMFCEKSLGRSNLELSRNVSVNEFYLLKALITLEQVNTSEWSKKNKNLN